MSWERVNVWTSTLYTLIHALHISKQINFGNLEYLTESVQSADSWVTPSCSYKSSLLAHAVRESRLTFRRDPNRYMPQISAHLVRMLVQDLVVILDAMLLDVLALHGEIAGAYPQSKIQKLLARLDAKHLWSAHGCLELVAVRNVLEHAEGTWNARTIEIVSPFMVAPPVNGEKLVIGVPMLFAYRRAMRTFVNEVSRV